MCVHTYKASLHGVVHDVILACNDLQTAHYTNAVAGGARQCEGEECWLSQPLWFRALTISARSLLRQVIQIGMVVLKPLAGTNPMFQLQILLICCCPFFLYQHVFMFALCWPIAL